MSSRILLAAVAALGAAGLHAQSLVTSVPGISRPAAEAAKVSVAPSMRLDGRAPSRDVRLDAPASSERTSKLAALNRDGKTAGRPQFIGFGRELPSASRDVRLDSLGWSTVEGGARAARVDVGSGGAAAIRVALRMTGVPDGLVVRFAAAGATVAVDSVAATEIAATARRHGEYWSPVIEGERVVIELEAPAGAALAGAKLELVRVSHLVVGPRTSPQDAAKILSDIGDSGTCNIDAACVNAGLPSEFVKQRKAVGKLVFSVVSGGTARCTGTLLNDQIGSFTPYIFSANHCFESAYEASTLNVWWFFDATACGGSTPGSYVVQTGGAFLLARSQDWDWALLQLNTAPPLDATFSGWNSAALAAGNNVTILHHPSGDLKKWSQGTTFAAVPVTFGTASGGAGLFTRVVWSNGTTEGGSSGGALLFNNGSQYEVRGGLLGGDALCSNPTGSDYFSQLGAMLVKTREYLTPNSQVSGLVPVIEFYHAGLNHYFVTALASEIMLLDGGFVPGWERTGFRFLAYASAGSGRSPVCRYYLIPEVGNSHFYSASPSECALVAQQFGSAWVLETSTAYYTALPDVTTGACPTGTQAVYRYFRPSELNHRFTIEVTVANELKATPGWTPEGYGPGPLFPIMCVPVGT